MVGAFVFGSTLCFAQPAKKPPDAAAKDTDKKTPKTIAEVGEAEKVTAGAAATGIFGLSCLAFGALALVPYFFPSIIAMFRKHPNIAPILVVNIFLGWSIVGWVVALAWAFTAQEGQSKRKSGYRESTGDGDLRF
ncbi:MAG: superinfection immunity protein [Planctomycetes bacterium]|nr:superinfection immunity protein [Planctomycetota bacterium]